jgi:hypothetical protein
LPGQQLVRTAGPSRAGVEGAAGGSRQAVTVGAGEDGGARDADDSEEVRGG